MTMDQILFQIEKRLDYLDQNKSLDNKNEYSVLDIVKNEIKSNTLSYEEILKKTMDKLDNLVGLYEVKKEVKKIVDYLIFYKKMNNKIKFDKLNLHTIFRGNPGTGKTTVARIIADLLYELDLVKNPIVKETTPKDFIAGYIGQTAIKTSKLISSAKGGVIFIDEAYNFSQSSNGKNNSFSNDAITEIIKAMESLDVVFIFAGYEKEMEDFINMNPGIKSRIGYDMTFEDYKTDELLKMLLKKIENSGFILEEGSTDILKNIIDKKKEVKNFGNGRMIDNLYNQIILEHASLNINETNDDNLFILKKETMLKLN